MLIPAIPLYLTTLGAAESQVGIIAMTFFIASVTMRLLTNVLLTRFKKSQILAAGVLLNTIVVILYAFAGTVGTTAVLRVMQGVGFGIITTITATMAADSLPDSRRGEGLGYYSISIVLAMAAGPAISLYMLDEFGFTPLFLAAAGFMLVAAILIAFFTNQPLYAPKMPEKRKGSIRLEDLFDRRLIIPAILLFLFGIIRSPDPSFISLFAVDRNIGHLSWYFIIQAITMFGIRMAVGRVSDRKGRNWILIPGGLAMIATAVTLSLAHTTAMMLLGAVFSGIGVGLLSPGMLIWAFSCVTPEKRNVASAANYNFNDIGISIGSASVGFLAENYGYGVMYQTIACFSLLFTIGYIIIGRDKSKNPDTV